MSGLDKLSISVWLQVKLYREPLTIMLAILYVLHYKVYNLGLGFWVLGFRFLG